jgi:hypothetical protein
MEAADGDPLRAQEIERGISGKWFWRYNRWREAEQALQKKTKKKHEAEMRKAKQRYSRKRR